MVVGLDQRQYIFTILLSTEEVEGGGDSSGACVTFSEGSLTGFFVLSHFENFLLGSEVEKPVDTTVPLVHPDDILACRLQFGESLCNFSDGDSLHLVHVQNVQPLFKEEHLLLFPGFLNPLFFDRQL